jgi:hypothetical protein
LDSFQQKELPVVTHLFLGGTLVLMVFLAWHNFYLYTLLSYEDHLVEWATVVSYLAAFVSFLFFAIHKRRIGDGLVALYCLVTGGEEFSWGQRLLGLSPPKFFMAANEQQEINFHNFFSGGHHDLIFATVALGYFVVVPLLIRNRTASALLENAGISVAPGRLAPWAVLLAILYIWHPLHLSSEWYEAVLAGMFFVAGACLNKSVLSGKHFLVSIGTVLALSIVLMRISTGQQSVHNVERAACARLETQQLLNDLIEGEATTPGLSWTVGHIRVSEASRNGLVDGSRLTRFREAQCLQEDHEQTVARRQYAVDPWGMSYWLHSEILEDGSLILTIYSFGPNRRRDSGEALPAASISASGDDIAVRNTFHYKPDQGASPPAFSVDQIR